jgi:hypothetical protein
LSSGCHHAQPQCGSCDFTPTPLGTISDSIWQNHEANAEASDFVIHEHEFIGNSARMNKGGEDHVKQIAVRMPGVPFPVLVEPSSMSVRPGDKYGFPVHGNMDLDMQRRTVIVKALEAMGVNDVDQRVVVSPAFTPGYQFNEAERAYSIGFNSSFSNGFGGGSNRGGGSGGAGF